MTTEASHPNGRPRPLALIVDDFPDGRDITRCVLANLGFRTMEAANGHDALTRVREFRPDLVVLDLALPGLDGWEVARRIRAEAPIAKTTILGYTAHAEKGPLERAREAGCDEILIKPCPPRELAEGIRRLMPTPSGSAWRRDDG
jgi:CheY-like chemotaxis protein